MPNEVIAEPKDVKTGEVDPNLWIALEDLQDGWERSGQVGQEVYGAGIAFGVVPRQYFKVEKGGFMFFNEYPATNFRVGQSEVTFYTRGDERLTFRMVIIPLEKGKKLPDITIATRQTGLFTEVNPIKKQKLRLEYNVSGNLKVRIQWKE